MSANRFIHLLADSLNKVVYSLLRRDVRQLKPYLLLIIPLLFVGFQLFLPLVSGQAQMSDWIPAHYDLSDANITLLSGANAGEATRLVTPTPYISPDLDLPAYPISGSKGWLTIFSDDLEGTFPTGWIVLDADAATYGTYYWGQRSCRPHTGSYSAWAVGGGTNGAALVCGSNYPDNAKSWMIYGPFSLVDATEAELRFWYWINTVPSADKLFMGASIDGNNYYGASLSGISDWSERVFDLTEVYTLGDLTGQPEVWIGIALISDATTNTNEGIYVDDIVIQKYIPGDPTPTPTPTATATPEPDDLRSYLPLVFARLHMIPEVPVLNTISNDDGDGNYTVTWSASEGAATYTLEEDDNFDFSSPLVAYSGSSISKAISGRDMGMYYYRVRASNSYASSGWSNIVSVTVTVPLPECPQTGAWTGTTSQGLAISFTVDNSNGCRIAANSLKITIRDSCYYTTTTTFALSYLITNNHFDTGSSTVRVIGDFTSLTAADGTFTLDMANPFPPPYDCEASGTWTTTAASARQ